MRAQDLWTVALTAGVFAPVVVRLFSPERQGFWAELTTITGLQVASLLVITVILPSRIKSLTRSFGIESVLVNHRTLGLLTVAVTLLHVIAVVVNDPRNVGLLVPFVNRSQPVAPVVDNWIVAPPARSIAGLLATVGLAAIVIWALMRQHRDLPYPTWRNWHITLTGLVLVMTAVHTLLIGHLVPTQALFGLLRGDPIGWQVLSAAVAQDPISPLFLALLAALLLVVGVRRWLLRPLHRYEVADVQLHLEFAATSLTLRPIGGKTPAPFLEGQFAWLRLSRLPFAEEHPFTVSSAAHESQPTFVIRHRGEWTDRVSRLRRGTPVWVDGPHGNFTPAEGTGGLVLVAAGIGITPMLSILRTAANAGRRWMGRRRSYRLIVIGEPLFDEELHELQRRLQLEIFFVESAPITRATFVDRLPPSRAERSRLNYYVCGPPGMVDDSLRALAALDVPRRHVHTELFVI